MPWPEFEALIVDLMHMEPGIKEAHLHGTPGPDSDLGVDVLARRSDGTVDAVQCKRVAGLTATKLASWCTEFLNHWDAHWAARRVNRFILAVSEPAHSIRLIEARDRESERFAKLGIGFEVWDRAQITRRLARDRRLVGRYFGHSTWPEVLCGPEPMATASPQAILSSATIGQIATLQSQLSSQAGRRIEGAYEDLRLGRLDEVQRLLDSFETSLDRSQLQGAEQAGLLRLEARLALALDRLDRAEELADLADALQPEAEPRLRARIIAERHGTEAALAHLGTPTTTAGLQLRASLLLGAGEIEATRELLEELHTDSPEEAETERLLSLANLLTGRRGDALQALMRAERLAPGWTAVRRAGAIVRYGAALSPGVGPAFLASPQPISPGLVRASDDARALLSRAIELLDGLQEQQADEQDRHWLLAALCAAGRLDRASALAKALLEERPGAPVVVGWAILCSLEVDLGPSQERLARSYSEGASPDEAQALGMLLWRTHTPEDAAAALEAQLDRQPAEARAEAKTWIDRLRGREDEPSSAAMRAGAETGDWEAAISEIARLAGEPAQGPALLAMADAVAGAGQARQLVPFIEPLLALDVPAAARIALFALAEAGEDERLLGAIDRASGLFGAELPGDVIRLRARALARLGRTRDALTDAARLALGSGDPEAALFQAELLAEAGRLADAPMVVRQALRDGLLSPSRALGWSQRLIRQDVKLSRELLKSAIEGGLPRPLLSVAFSLTHALGLAAEADALWPEVVTDGRRTGEVVLVESAEELERYFSQFRHNEEAVLSLYMSGAIPIHSYARKRSDLILGAAWANDERDAAALPLTPRLTRNGARTPEGVETRPWSEWQLHLDVTGLLAADRLGILENLESHPNGIRISPRLGVLLRQMESLSGDAQLAWPALERAVAALDAKLVKAVEVAPAGSLAVALEGDGGLPLRDWVLGLSALRRIPDELAEAILGGPAASDGAPPDPDRPALLSAEALQVLAAHDAIDCFARVGSLLVTDAEGAKLRRERDRLRSRGEQAMLAGALAERIGRGVEKGIYHTVGRTAAHDADGGDAAELQLRDLLAAGETATNGEIWFEDRNLTGFVQAGRLQIVGAAEVIAALRTSDAISDADVRRLMADLRRSGAVLSHVSPEEVVQALQRAPVVSGRVIETPELATMRRAFAAHRLLENHLKIGPAEGLLADRPDEHAVARATLGLLASSLAGIWSCRDLSAEHRFALADWAVSAFRTARVLRDLPDADPDSREFVEAMQVAHCLDKAIDIGGLHDEAQDDRLQFLHWCWERLVVPRLKADRDFLERISGYLTSFYGGLLQERPGRGRDDLMYEQLLRMRAERLPEPISEPILTSGIFARTMKLSQQVTLGESRFHSDRFWNAVRAAVQHGAARLKRSDGRWARLRRGPAGLIIEGPEKATIGGDLPWLIAAEGADRQQLIARLVGRCDLPQASAEAWTAKLSSARRPAEVAELTRQMERESVECRYAAFDESLRLQRGAETEILRPRSIAEILAWLRLDGRTGSVAEAAQALAEEFGFAESFRRLSGLPLEEDAWARLSASSDEVEAAAEAAQTSMALLASIRLLKRLSFPDARISSQVQRLASTIIENGELYRTCLLFADAQLSRDPAWATGPQRNRWLAVWAHGERIADGFLRHRINPDPVQQGLGDMSNGVGALESAVFRRTGPIDVVDPAGLTKSVLAYRSEAFLDRLLGARLEDLMPEALRAPWRALSIVQAEDEPGFDHNLFLHSSPTASDELGSLLSARSEVDREAAGPRAVLTALIESNLLLVGEGPDDPVRWRSLAASLARGAGAEQAESLLDLLQRHAISPLPALDDRPHLFLWRGMIGPVAWARHGDDAGLLRRLTLAARRMHPGPVALETPADDAVEELIYTAMAIARHRPSLVDDEALARSIREIAVAWPESAGRLRLVLSAILARTSPARAEPLWRVQAELNAMA
jgi:tetratricopeptide (TPR) repeat protein